ncbi:ATP-binding protein [Streptomyces sp. NPDC005480]|uniref:ATP-binding protein n=1 Tax=Streptomyces sp. NPDC005480 TaxID=3154880 RepID=UPI0033A8CD1A
MTTVSPPPWTYALHLPHDPRAPGIARATLRLILDAHGLADLTDDAELLASELLTNAHLHTIGPYALRLGPAAVDPGRLRVAVWDSNPRIPSGFGPVRNGDVPPEGAEGGRGLHQVRPARRRGARMRSVTRRAGSCCGPSVREAVDGEGPDRHDGAS